MTTFLIILLLLFSPQDGYTQDYYSGRKEVYGGDQIYRVTGGQKIVSVKNIQNRVRNEIRYNQTRFAIILMLPGWGILPMLIISFSKES